MGSEALCLWQGDIGPESSPNAILGAESRAVDEVPQIPSLADFFASDSAEKEETNIGFNYQVKTNFIV